MNVLARLPDIENYLLTGKIYPSFADFHTSDVCNHNCNGCAYKGKHSHSIMDEEKHYAAVSILRGHGVKAFDFAGGGEPTMLPYLPELMKYITEIRCNFGLITNGSNLSPALIDELLCHGTYLRVSLEASSPQMFAQYKGVPATQFYKIVDTLKGIVQERNRRKSELEVSIKFSVSKSLRGPQHYRMMGVLASFLGVDRVSIKPLRHEPEELTTNERYAEYGLFLKSIPAQRSFKVVESFIPTNIDDVPQCWLNPLHVVMDHAGDLYLCCYYYYRDNDFKIGNIFEKPFDEIWLSKLHKQKIANIRRESCAKVDCKFFKHHKDVGEALTRGKVYFL